MKNSFFFKKVVKLFLLLIILVISVWGKVCKCEQFLGGYYYVGGGDYFGISIKNGTNKFSHFREYYFSDRPAYLIDVDKNFMKVKFDYTDDYEKIGLTFKQYNYIQLIAYYGYEYPKHRDNLYYYMAAQELIYEALSDVEFYYTDEPKLDGREMDISVYKNEILELVRNHFLLPNFKNLRDNYAIGDEIELVDNNGILSNYEVIDDGGLIVKLVNNKIVIVNDGNYIGNYTIKLVKKSYLDGLAYFYYGDNSSTMFTPGRIEEMQISVNIKISGASLCVKNLDKNGLNIDGLGEDVYEFYDENDKLLTTLVMDKENCVEVNNLKFGNYKIRRKKLGYGYKENEDIYFIKIDSAYKEYNIYKETIMKKLEIYGKFSNSSFLLFNILRNGEIYNNIVISSEYASIMLPYGSYIIRQARVSDTSQLLWNMEFVIDDSSEDVITYNLDDVALNKNVLVNNPYTYDDILKYIGCLVVCFLFVVGVYIFRKYVIIRL